MTSKSASVFTSPGQLRLQVEANYSLHGLANSTIETELSRIRDIIGDLNETVFQNEAYGIHGINKSSSVNFISSAIQIYKGNTVITYVIS